MSDFLSWLWIFIWVTKTLSVSFALTFHWACGKGNCKEELPKKPFGWLSVNCRPTVDRQVTDSLPTANQCITHVGCCIKRKPRENIKVCVNVLPTSYRQVADTLPTVGPLSAHCRPTGSLYFRQNLSAVCWPTDDQLLADCRLTVDRQSADRFFEELFFTITVERW